MGQHHHCGKRQSALFHHLAALRRIEGPRSPATAARAMPGERDDAAKCRPVQAANGSLAVAETLRRDTAPPNQECKLCHASMHPDCRALGSMAHHSKTQSLQGWQKPTGAHGDCPPIHPRSTTFQTTGRQQFTMGRGVVVSGMWQKVTNQRHRDREVGPTGRDPVLQAEIRGQQGRECAEPRNGACCKVLVARSATWLP